MWKPSMKEITQTTCFSHLELVFIFHPVPLLVYYLQAAASVVHIRELPFLKHAFSVELPQSIPVWGCVSAVPSERLQLEQGKATLLASSPVLHGGAGELSWKGKKSKHISPGTASESRTQQQRWSEASREPDGSRKVLRSESRHMAAARRWWKRAEFSSHPREECAGFYATQKPTQLLLRINWGQKHILQKHSWQTGE